MRLFGRLKLSFRLISASSENILKKINKMPDLLVCRACLAYKVPVYNILRTRYQQAYERMAAISMADNIKLHTLCAPCLETLDKCCRLQEKCAISEGILSRLLQQNQLTEDAIQAIDRQQHNLTDTLPTFILETIKQNESKPEDIKKKTGPNTEPCDIVLESPTDNATLKTKFGKRQSSENVTDKAVLRIEPNITQSLEDLRHVVVKTELDITPENPTDNIMAWIEPGMIKCPEEPSLCQIVKIEPGVTQSSEVTDNVEAPMSAFAKEPLNQSNLTISIETVKLKEKPYIQIGAGELLRNVKSEVDDNDSLVEIDVEGNQHVDTEISQVSDVKNIQASNSNKSFKGVKVQNFIEKCKVDGRMIKKVSSVDCETNKPESPTNKTLHCNKCPYQTPYKNRLMYHMKKHSGFVICAVCDYKCATKSRLVSHLRVHTKERPYVCKACNKGFTEISSLSKHMNMHGRVKPYKCLWCEYQAASKNHLDRHIKRHIGDKRFRCELCDYACVQKCDLTRHAKIHDHERSRSFKRVCPVIIKTVSMAKE